jgi:succinate dehydrogenase flavin-adding protein (antitoxin of CptAB toxin-antitoxin module)
MNDTDKILKKIKVTKQCQRNWDTTPVLPEHIDFFKSVLENVPKKQGRMFHKILFIEDVDLIDNLYYNSRDEGCDYAHNAQVKAPFLVVFVPYSEGYLEKISDDVLSDFNKVINEDTTFPYNQVDVATSMGIHMGILAMAATQLGYSTGFCSCFDSNFKKTIENLLHDEISSKILKTEDMLSLGIGYSNNKFRHNYDPFLKTHMFSHKNAWNDSKNFKHIK